MTAIQKFIFYSQNLSIDFIKKLCFLNNIRSKYLTIILILCSLAFTFYDISILQKMSEYKVFLIHFKTDIIFLVFSFIFAIYINFNQVKTHKDIRNHHRYIHGIISLFILFWCMFKSIIFVHYNNGHYHIAIIGIILTSFLYLFPTLIYISHLVFSLIFAVIISLLFNLTIHSIFNDIIFILVIAFLAIIISRYIIYLQIKILYKDAELNRYKKRKS